MDEANVVQNVASKNTPGLVDDEETTPEHPSRENQIDPHRGREARRPIEGLDSVCPLALDSEASHGTEGRRVTSAPESISSATSVTSRPVPDRSVTLATGAGGSKVPDSYRGIRFHLEHEIGAVLAVRQAR